MGSSALHAALALFLTAALGCGGRSTPEGTLEAFADAVARGDASRAWALTSASARAATSRERFDADFRRRVEAGPDYVDRLRKASDGGVGVSASLPYSDYETLRLEYARGGWVIVGGVGDTLGQSTPHEALVTFIRAAESRDFATLLRLVPPEYRARIQASDLDDWLSREAESLTESLALIKAHVDEPIRVAGDTATFVYGTRHMQLSRENGGWVIADFE